MGAKGLSTKQHAEVAIESLEAIDLDVPGLKERIQLIVTSLKRINSSVRATKRDKRLSEEMSQLLLKALCVAGFSEEELEDCVSSESEDDDEVMSDDGSQVKLLDSDDEDEDEDEDVPLREQREPTAEDSEAVKYVFRSLKGTKLFAACRFPLIDVLRRVDKHLSENDVVRYRRMLGGGRTQARKTPMKAAAMVMGKHHGFSSVLITTTCDGRNDLAQKLTELVSDTPADLKPQFHVAAEVNTRVRDTVLAEFARGGNCLVVNNSKAAIDKVRGMVQQTQGVARDQRLDYKGFMLILDEADDFYRTDADTNDESGDTPREKMIKMEIALRCLKRCEGLRLQFEVTATLLAIYLKICKANGSGMSTIEAADIIYSEPSAEYTGPSSFYPMKDEQGEEIFLSKNELRRENLYISAKVKALYKRAAANNRSLLLDVTTPAVTAPGNVHQKAKKTLKLHANVIAIVVTGGHVTVYRMVESRMRTDRYTSKSRMSDGSKLAFHKVLAMLDEEQRAVNGELSQPVFVFGYSQLQRGISYRSQYRAPSHYLLDFGDDMPICRLVQTAGRASGEQKQLLMDNGFGGRVTILTKPFDYDTIQNYPAFLDEVKGTMDREQQNLRDAITKFTYPAEHNFKYGQRRTVAPKKNHAEDAFKEAVNFEEHTPGMFRGERAFLKEIRDGKGLLYGILEVMKELEAFDAHSAITAAAIKEELDTGSYGDDLIGRKYITNNLADPRVTTTQKLINKVVKTVGSSTRKANHYWLDEDEYARLLKDVATVSRLKKFSPISMARKQITSRRSSMPGTSVSHSRSSMPSCCSIISVAGTEDVPVDLCEDEMTDTGADGGGVQSSTKKRLHVPTADCRRSDRFSKKTKVSYAQMDAGEDDDSDY